VEGTWKLRENYMAVEEARVALEEIAAGARAHDLETETLDFKEQASVENHAVRDIVEAALCFANGAGGTVVVGVANKVAGPAAFIGTSLAADYVKKRIHDLTEPPLLTDVVLETAQGTALLLVRVPQSPEIHADKKGRAPRRIGTDCLPMSPAEQARLREERQGIDWSASSSRRGIEDALPAALATARSRLAVFTDSRRELATLGDAQLLTELNLATKGGKLTRAGEILFCPVSKQQSPRIVYQYRVTPGGEPTAIERLQGPLILEFERILEFIRARRHLTPLTLPDGQQIHVEDFPDLAVREAAVNAVIHRDYHLGSAVTIDHSPEVFVVSSPGPLVSGVTPENIITHPSKPRNHSLAHAARVLGFAEEIGRGVDRMYREMIRSGRDVPKIESSADYVRVTLVGGAPNTQIARYVAQLPQTERDDTDTMLVLFNLISEKHVTAHRLAPVLQKTPEEAEAVLRRLAGDSASMLEPTRQSARRSNPSYRLRGEALQALGSAVAYQRRTTDEIDRKVIAHVQEYDKVTNRTIRNLFDVSTQRAAAILGDLVARDVLVKTSEAQRGPSVEYGRGTKFPSAPMEKRRSSSAQPELEGFNSSA
jgi:ATP-dependent DNA helicase RecG